MARHPIGRRRRIVAVGLITIACGKPSERVVHDTVYVPAVAGKVEPVVNPCDRPRPYKNWSNAELNVAQVEAIGTPRSMEFIREAGCRTR